MKDETIETTAFTGAIAAGIGCLLVVLAVCTTVIALCVKLIMWAFS